MKTTDAIATSLLIAVLTIGMASTVTASTVFVFGDSLSDDGNLAAATAGLLPPPFQVPPDPPYTNGRRTNGQVWTDYLRADFPHARFDNVAQAGAIAGTFAFGLVPGVDVPIDNLNDIAILGIQAAAGAPPALLPDVIGLQEQVNRFGGTSAVDDLGVIWVGANDFFAATATTPPVIRTPDVVIEDIKTAARTLHAKGISSLVIGNLPDLGTTPAANLSGNPAAFSGLTQLFNLGLVDAAVELAAELPDLQLQIVDVFSAFEAVLDNPAAFGITNTTDPCIPVGPSRDPPDPFAVPVTPFEPACGDPNNYVFYDVVHPTTVLHRAIADEFSPFLQSANVPLPAVWWLMLTGLTMFGSNRLACARRT